MRPSRRVTHRRLRPAEPTYPSGNTAIGFAISFVASYIAINLFMWLIRRMGTLTLWPFAVFTAATGAIVLAVVYGG